MRCDVARAACVPACNCARFACVIRDIDRSKGDMLTLVREIGAIKNLQQLLMTASNGRINTVTRAHPIHQQSRKSSAHGITSTRKQRLTSQRLRSTACSALPPRPLSKWRALSRQLFELQRCSRSSVAQFAAAQSTSSTPTQQAQRSQRTERAEAR